MITSLKVEVKYKDPSIGEEITKKVPFWNATIANLTLMALGSSAPEIILAVLDTSTKLGKCPGELGAATIVGSAAFNLLVISGVSIYAVTGDPNVKDEDGTPGNYKIIKELGVFGITAVTSIFAYVWLWIVLMDMQVAPYEAWLTLAFFPILVIACYGADYYNQDPNAAAADAPVKLDFSYLDLQK